MAAVEQHKLGTICWVDLTTSDPDAARRFYAELFGWSFSPSQAQPQHSMCQLAGQDVAGIGPLPPGGNPHAAWNVYFTVESLEDAAGRVAGAGGQVTAAPIDVPSAGRMGFCLDPAGATFGLWQPQGHPGARLVAEPNTMFWFELNSRDGRRSSQFYEQVFRLTPQTEAGAPSEYTTLYQGKQAAAGILQMPPNELPSHWMVYFAVSDTDTSISRATASGATLRVSPIDTPNGRVAFLSDPQGASFALITAPSD